MLESPPQELEAEICTRIIARLAQTLKPQFAEIVQAIDLDDVPVKRFAAVNAVSASNAGARLFRARRALKARVIRSAGRARSTGVWTVHAHNRTECGGCNEPRSAALDT